MPAKRSRRRKQTLAAVDERGAERLIIFGLESGRNRGPPTRHRTQRYGVHGVPEDLDHAQPPHVGPTQPRRVTGRPAAIRAALCSDVDV